MRPIKFRAWDAVKEYWIVVILKKGASFFPISEMFRDMDCSGRNLTDWQQFTGLKDKNGVEIYEGDIVQSSSELIIGTIRWLNTDENACFGIWDGINKEWYWFEHYPASELIVIGNIYENFDLLEVC